MRTKLFLIALTIITVAFYGFTYKSTTVTDYRMTNSIHSNTSNIDIFDLENSDQHVTWLGVDCSLYKIKSNMNLTQEIPIKKELIEGIKFYRRSHVPDHTLESWLKVKGRFTAQTEYGYEQSKKNLTGQWIIHKYEIFSLTRKDIKDHIKKISANGNGIGFIQIPEITDMEDGKHYGWLVFFDFATKEVIWMNRYTVDRKLNDSPRRGHFGTEWLLVMKKFVDGEYK